ncbi:hypothetical protein ABZ372_46950, partial [Streptomyces sp. NPDC005921]
ARAHDIAIAAVNPEAGEIYVNPLPTLDEGAVALSVDGKSQLQAPDRSQPCCRSCPAGTRRTPATRRGGQTSKPREPTKPFIRVKTSEEILHSPARPWRRISGAGP